MILYLWSELSGRPHAKLDLQFTKGSGLLGRKRDKGTGKYGGRKRKYWVRGLAPINIAASLPSLIISSLGFRNIKRAIIHFFYSAPSCNQWNRCQKPAITRKSPWLALKQDYFCRDWAIYCCFKWNLNSSNRNGSKKYGSASDWLLQKKKQKGMGREISMKIKQLRKNIDRRHSQDLRASLGQNPDHCVEGRKPKCKWREGMKKREQKVKKWNKWSNTDDIFSS